MNRTAIFPYASALVAAAMMTACGGNDIENDAGATPAPGSDASCLALDNSGSTVVVGSNQPGDPSLPEAASGYRTGMKPVYAKTYLVATSNAYASAAGCAVLKRGGTAADAAVAVQAVLGLTVPEATGLGSGGVLLYYDARGKTLQAYDGRETAPAAATENYLRYVDDQSDQSAPQPNARMAARQPTTRRIRSTPAAGWGGSVGRGAYGSRSTLFIDFRYPTAGAQFSAIISRVWRCPFRPSVEVHDLRRPRYPFVQHPFVQLLPVQTLGLSRSDHHRLLESL